MNQSERRYEDVEEQLRGLEAPEPPPRLLESLVEEIPEDLGARTPHAAARRRWRLLAASLAVVTVGGVLGYRLLEEPLVVPEAHAPDVATGSEETVRESLPQAQQELPASPAGETAPGADARPRVLELGEVVVDDSGRARSEAREPAPPAPAAQGTDPVAVEEVVVLQQIPKPRAPSVPIPDPTLDEMMLYELPSNHDVAVDPRKRGELRARQETLQEQLRSLSGAAIGRVAPPTAPPSTGGTAEPNDQPYGDMFFRGYGTNPFVDTEDDALSTFGIDVDTASYTMARSYLRRGHLPPADAVRVEEFVNFFDYGDRAPRSRDFAVVAEGAPSPFASTARTYLLRFALKGREIRADRRKPAVLTFVVDVSGSMNRENRLGLVKRALRLLVDQLDEGDAVGLVVYGSRGQVLLEPTGDHERVLAAIDRLQSGGSTNAEEGLLLGYETARDRFREGAINRVVLCSDGVANVGATGPDSILRRIENEAAGGIELTAVGFGMGNYNDVLMEQLADRGDGNYAYVDDLEAARRVFVENLTGTLQTIAGDAKVQVEFDPLRVQSYRLLGYENRDIADRDFRNDAVDAGEIGAGHQVTALYEVKLREGAPDAGVLATLRLRYRSKRTGRVVEDSVALELEDLARRWRGASSGMRLAAIVAEFAEHLRGSYWARETSLDELAAEARDLRRTGPRAGDVAQLVELIEIAARLDAGGTRSEEGEGFER